VHLDIGEIGGMSIAQRLNHQCRRGFSGPDTNGPVDGSL